MDDKEQAAIDALRVAGLDDEARAVEQLRGRHTKTMDAYHAGQRDSYKAGQAAEREHIRVLVEAVRHANGDAGYGDTVMLLTAGQERAWLALLAALKGPNVRGKPPKVGLGE